VLLNNSYFYVRATNVPDTFELKCELLWFVTPFLWLMFVCNCVDTFEHLAFQQRLYNPQHSGHIVSHHIRFSEMTDAMNKYLHVIVFLCLALG